MPHQNAMVQDHNHAPVRLASYQPAKALPELHNGLRHGIRHKRVAALSVYGNDYPTPDGTGVRDYIHVVDLAAGHLKALEALDRPQCIAVNLGTGVGYSVLDVVKAFEAASGQPVPYRIGPRRPGDVAACYADPRLAIQLLGWKAERDLAAMCQDHWRWQKHNPQGYV